MLFFFLYFLASWLFFFSMNDLVPIVPRAGPAWLQQWTGFEVSCKLGPVFIALLAREKLLQISIWKGHRFQWTFPSSSQHASTLTARRVLICYRGRGMLLLLRCQAQNPAHGLAVPLCQRRQKTSGESHSIVTFYWAWSSLLCVLIRWKWVCK